MSTYSYSRLNTFENCAYQYKLRYIDSIKIEKDTIERFLGSTIHSTLEYLYNDVKAGNKRELNLILKLYHWFWNKTYHKNIIIVKKQYSLNHYRKVGETCIKRYYEKHFPFNKNKVIALEERINIKLDYEGMYVLTGVVDRIDETKEGYIEIHDYKTGMTLPSQQDIEEERQLALYNIGLSDTYGKDKQINLIWHYLMFGTEFVLNKTPQQLDKVKLETISVIKRIEDTKEFLPNKGPLCNYCEYYKEICS